MSEFKEGEHIFLHDGCPARYVGKHPYDKIYFIQKLFCEDDDECGQEDIELGPIEETRHIYKEEPVFRKNSRIAELDNQIDLLLEKSHSIEKEIKERTQLLVDMKKRCENTDILRNIFDFMDGGITHFVDEYLNIKMLDEVLKYNEYHGRSPKYRLLSLYGESKGVLSWKANSYCDGSGSDASVTPFTSYEDALSYVRTQCCERNEEIKNGKIKIDGYDAHILYDRCKRHDLPMQGLLRDYWDKQKDIRHQEKIKKRKEEYELAKKAFEAALTEEKENK